VNERQRIASGSPFESEIGFCRALRVGDRVVVAGTAPIWPDGSCDPDPGVQARRCLEIILASLAEAGAGPE
jgi:enamine deaminase RidA (YjgF/YER057c/UK114 family)